MAPLTNEGLEGMGGVAGSIQELIYRPTPHV
jgi:hypothetical protein